MENKLAFRNAKRSMKDYLIYLVTLTMVAAMMFAFNTMVFSREILDMCEDAMIMQVMIGVATFFIVFIVAWLIHYMVRFMLEKRSREFGTYLLLGMKKRSVGRLYRRENLLLGLFAFCMGSLFGLLLQQILMTVFYRVFSEDYRLHLQISAGCLLMTAGCYFGSFFFALLRNGKLFRRMTIADLMRMEKENEKIEERNEEKKKWLFYAAAVYMVFYFAMLFRGKYAWGPAIFMTALFFVSIYLIYFGLSAYIIRFLENGGSSGISGSRLFLLRQLASKLKTMRFTMGTLTVLFICALVISSVSMMLARYQGQAVAEEMPFGLLMSSSDVSDTFAEELAACGRENTVEASVIYHIYQDGTSEMNDYLYTHVGVLGGRYKNADGTLNADAVKEAGSYAEYFEYDTFLPLSEYNALRRMLGYEEVTLLDGEYLLHVKKRVKMDLDDAFLDRSITAGGKKLQPAGVYTEPFALNGNIGADYILVAPDAVCAKMKPYFSGLAADFAEPGTRKLYDELLALHEKKEKLPDYDTYEEAREAGAISEEEDWQRDAAALWRAGTDQILVMSSDILISDIDGKELIFLVTTVTFPLVYISFVFLCAAMTILAVQQMSDSAKYRFRYETLRKLGLSGREIDRIILRQLLYFYLVPVLLAAVLGAVISIYIGSQFVRFTGAADGSMYYFGISLLLFFGIYCIYFGATYIGFRRNVRILHE